MRTLGRWSDRKAWTEVPLFSGYCFARFALKFRLDVLNIPGIVNIVGVAGPQPIPSDEIDALQKAVASRRAYGTHGSLAEGSWVEVVRGPLAGVKGQLIRNSGQDYVVIRIRLLQQSAAVHIDLSEVVPLQQTLH
jgi:transcription antitermination factor NusG